jgi:uroporphyrinogen III methyltransferase / synthase
LAGARLKVDLIPAQYQAEGLLEVLSKEQLAGSRILIPRAEVARDLLPDELRAHGADVTVAVAYRTVRPEADVARLIQALRSRTVGVVAFTSSSTVTHYMGCFASAEEARTLTEGVVVACIGPITAQTAQAAGLKVVIQPKANTVSALAEAIAEYFAPSSCEV